MVLVLTTKTYPGGCYIAQLHFTLNNDEVQSIIEHSVKDDVSKNIPFVGFPSIDGEPTNGIYSSRGL